MDQQVPKSAKQSILENLQHYTEADLRKLVADLVARPRVGLYWERDAVQRDRALNDAHVFAKLDEALSHGDGLYGNLVIEGENFDALRMLRTTHLGQVRVIFIDPPYNTGKSDFLYNDKYMNKDDRDRQSTWLDWLYRRLRLAYDLLTPDGVVLVCINDENRARLELLMETVFPGMRIGSFVWKSRKSTNDEGDHNLSVDHEHVLVFGREEFSFGGLSKKNSDYKFEDADGRVWASAPLNVSVAWNDKRAGNALYALQDTDTDFWYPCNPDSVWRYASRERLAKGQRLKTKPIEQLVEEKRISFPASPRTAIWSTIEALREAIAKKEVPHSSGRPLIRDDLPEDYLLTLVGKTVAWGRPRLKRYLDEQKTDRQPVSSWIRSTSLKEKNDDKDRLSLETTYSDSGNHLVKEIFGYKAFNTAKPLSLVKNILRSLSREDDIILDFFAGSGTTAHAVMELNKEDDGMRRFIMVSSTEATDAEPSRNICRDVCAARVRAVMKGYGKKEALGGTFAYLRTFRIEHGDLPFEATTEMLWNTLCLMHGGVIAPMPSEAVKRLPTDEVIFFCQDPGDEELAELARLLSDGGVVYTDRPTAVSDLFEDSAVDVRSALEATQTAAFDVEYE